MKKWVVNKETEITDCSLRDQDQCDADELFERYLKKMKKLKKLEIFNCNVEVFCPSYLSKHL